MRKWLDRHLLPVERAAEVEAWITLECRSSPAFADVIAGFCALESAASGHPLAQARLWEPECRAPACARPDKGKPWRGVTLLPTGQGLLHACPSCGWTGERTSQRLAVRRILAHHRLHDAILPGGNRSGKTEAGAQIDLAFCYGKAHPAVKLWAFANDLSLDRVQSGPGRVWVEGLTWSDAMEFLRPKLDLYIPTTAKRRHWGQNQQAEAVLPGGGVIVSKVVEQGREQHQGGSIDFLHFDEEPHDPEVVEEAGMRCVDRNAPRLFTFTSLNGWTPLLKDLLAHRLTGKPPKYGVVDIYPGLRGEDNPHINHEVLTLRAVGARSASRLTGEVVDLSGRVHADWRRDIHVVPAFAPPPEWPRMTGIDFGFRDPFVCLWAAQAPDDVLHIYREHYRSEQTTAYHAQAIHDAELCPTCWPRTVHGDREPVGSPEWWRWRIESDRRAVDVITARRDRALARRLEATRATRCPECDGIGRTEPEPSLRLADPADAQSINTLSTQYGIACVGAKKSRQTSYDALCRRLALDSGGRPHLVVHDCCPETIREMEALRWGRQTVHEEVVVVGDDHAWDVLRYLALGLEHHGYTRGGGGM